MVTNQSPEADSSIQSQTGCLPDLCFDVLDCQPHPAPLTPISSEDGLYYNATTEPSSSGVGEGHLAPTIQNIVQFCMRSLCS
jgi:hypothetical protein